MLRLRLGAMADRRSVTDGAILEYSSAPDGLKKRPTLHRPVAAITLRRCDRSLSGSLADRATLARRQNTGTLTFRTESCIRVLQRSRIGRIDRPHVAVIDLRGVYRRAHGGETPLPRRCSPVTPAPFAAIEPPR